MKGIRCPRFRLFGRQWQGNVKSLFLMAGLTARGRRRKFIPRCVPGLSKNKAAYNRWYRRTHG